MGAPTEDFTFEPQFINDPQGKPQKATLPVTDYVRLLLKACITNPKLYPPGMEKFAHALKTVRRLEEKCIAEHGEFDWEKLSPDEQDEYDGALVDLAEAESAGEPPKPLEQVLRELNIEPEAG